MRGLIYDSVVHFICDPGFYITGSTNVAVTPMVDGVCIRKPFFSIKDEDSLH